MPVLTRTTAEPELAGPGPLATAPAAPAGPPVDLAVPCWTRVAGQTLVALGGLMVALAAFQLWGTALIEWRAQRALSAELASATARSPLGSELFDTPLAAGSRAADARPPVGRSTLSPEADGAMGSAANSDPSTVGPDDADAVRHPVTPLGWLDNGDPVGRIDIPAIGLSKAFVEGVDRDVLRRGPGHDPGTALPGHPGNTAIAGHRTTHGAPFYHLDELVPGDEIVLTTAEGEFRYVVDAHTDADGASVGHVIVTPDEVGVLADAGDNRLTLTACHPRYSARQRIVVTAHLVGPALTFADPADAQPSSPPAGPGAATGPGEAPSAGAVPTPPATPPPPVAATAEELARRQAMVAVPAAMGAAGAHAPFRPAAAPATLVDPTARAGLDPGLGWQDDQLAPTILWATVCAVLAHAAWVGGRLWRRRWAYGTGAAAFVPCLFLCFVHLDRVLPAF
ncbi:MAG: class E sortase [Acidimicrobiales bacterium]